jgi:transcriptional regulator with XRE-family HTH domain
MTARQIGEKLRARMGHKRWTQKDLVKATGIGQSQVSRICAGDFKRVTANVAKLCEYAGVAPHMRTHSRLSRELTAAVGELIAGSKSRERAFLRLIDAGSELFASRQRNDRG